jgi:hypothetical protein
MSNIKHIFLHVSLIPFSVKSFDHCIFFLLYSEKSTLFDISQEFAQHFATKSPMPKPQHLECYSSSQNIKTYQILKHFMYESKKPFSEAEIQSLTTQFSPAEPLKQTHRYEKIIMNVVGQFQPPFSSQFSQNLSET